MIECAGQCVEHLWDSANCGSCGRRCGEEQYCENGDCIDGWGGEGEGEGEFGGDDF